MGQFEFDLIKTSLEACNVSVMCCEDDDEIAGYTFEPFSLTEPWAKVAVAVIEAVVEDTGKPLSIAILTPTGLLSQTWSKT